MPRATTTSPPDPRAALRRAAVVVANLDRELADALLGRLPAEQAQRVRRAVVELGDVADDERDEALAQFVRAPALAPLKTASGIELDDRLARNLAGAPPRAPVGTAVEDDPPFRFLHESNCDDLPELLVGEHPQTVAVVLAHLPAAKAADLVAALPSSVRVDALRRLASLEQTDATVVREIEQVVKNWLATRGDSGRRATGVTAVASILRAADTAVQHDVLTGIARRDRSLAERLAPPPRSVSAAPRVESADASSVAMEAIDALDGPTLAAALATMEVQAAALALAGSAGDTAARALAALPAQIGDAVRRAMAELGPMRLADIEAARRQLAAAAGRATRASSAWRAAG